jgi:hypothetical protein
MVEFWHFGSFGTRLGDRERANGARCHSRCVTVFCFFLCGIERSGEFVTSVTAVLRVLVRFGSIEYATRQSARSFSKRETFHGDCSVIADPD